MLSYTSRYTSTSSMEAPSSGSPVPSDFLSTMESGKSLERLNSDDHPDVLGLYKSNTWKVGSATRLGNFWPAAGKYTCNVRMAWVSTVISLSIYLSMHHRNAAVIQIYVTCKYLQMKRELTWKIKPRLHQPMQKLPRTNKCLTPTW